MDRKPWPKKLILKNLKDSLYSKNPKNVILGIKNYINEPTWSHLRLGTCYGSKISKNSSKIIKVFFLGKTQKM